MVNTMRINVKILQGGECTVEVLPTTLVSDMKKEIAEKLNIPADEQKLLFLGRALADEQTIQSYPSLKDGTRINLVVKKPEGFLEVSAKYFRRQGMSEHEANVTAQRFLRVLQEKFNRLSWDDLDRLAEDCMRSEQRSLEHEILNDINKL